jgi:hypothetical protein
MQPTRFSIIIVNWNTGDLLIACLQSIRQHSPPGLFEIIVVDNASTDDSCNQVQSHFPEVKLIRNQANLGFSIANNQGIRHSQGQYIMLLNPDACFLNDVLSALKQTFDPQQDIGVIGASLITPNNTPQRWARGNFLSLRTAFNHYLFLSDLFPKSRFFAGIADNVNYRTLTEMDWVSGACLTIRREALDRVGLLDESLFMYNEDMELCYRVKQGGYRVVYLPTAQVKHFVSQSMRRQPEKKIQGGPLYSQDFLYQRLYGAKGLWLFRLMICLGALLRLLFRLAMLVLRPNSRSKYRWHEARRNAANAVQLWRGGV